MDLNLIEKHRTGQRILKEVEKYTGNNYEGFIIRNDIIYLKRDENEKA